MNTCMNGSCRWKGRSRINGSAQQEQEVVLAFFQLAMKDGVAEANRSTTICGWPNTLESGSEKLFDCVMYCLLRKLIV
jgi:hypothetical protein